MLRLWDLTALGFGNQYYAATVKSMTTSLPAFLYGSFDPGLFVSVDKPAPGLWPQALAAKLFGFSSATLLLPQAICGIASVFVIGRIVGRAHGAAAGTIAALALAVAPVAVAVDRNNTMDAELVLVLLLAVWCAMRSIERGARWLVLAGVLVGVGFEIKMSQAYLAVPAIALAYLLAAPRTVLARVGHVIAFGAVVIAASIAWLVFVDLTPADERPFVGSTANNSAFELALGHNGLERLPQEILFWRRPAPGPAGPPPPGAAPQPAQPPGPGPNDEAGERGALRLFNPQLAGQVSWYIPLALVGALAILARGGPRRPLGPARASAVLWLLWLVPAAILFSWSGIFHRYYLVMLAPPLAALVGAGTTTLVEATRSGGAWRWPAVAAALTTAITHAVIIQRAPLFAPWLTVLVAIGAIAAVASTVALRGRRLLGAAAIASIFAAPLVWAGTTLSAFDSGLPFAGPELLARAAGAPRPQGIPGGQPSRLYEFLVTEHRGERWVAATSSQGTASALMLRGDVAVMALGGFSGGDPILTPRSLEDIVRRGELRFVITEERMRPELGEWVRRRCVPVPASRTGGPLLPSPRPAQPAPGIFDCVAVRGLP